MQSPLGVIGISSERKHLYFETLVRTLIYSTYGDIGLHNCHWKSIYHYSKDSTIILRILSQAGSLTKLLKDS